MSVDFPFARSLVVVRNERTVKKTGRTTRETHYYISSAPTEDHAPDGWLKLVRGHWAGVEIRNHWRRDVLWREDYSCSRNPNLLGNQALLRSALLAVLAEHCPAEPLTQVFERLHSHPAACLQLIAS